MSIRRGYREHKTRGIFPIHVRVLLGSVVVETPRSYKNTNAIAPSEARSLSRALMGAADAIERYEKKKSGNA